MDFSQVKDARIPQGIVKYIENEARTVCYWKRPFEYPALCGYLESTLPVEKYGNVITHGYTWPLYDIYGTSKIFPETSSFTDTQGRLNVFYRRKFIEVPAEHLLTTQYSYDVDLTWLRDGTSRWLVCGLLQKEQDFPTYLPRHDNAKLEISTTFNMYASNNGLLSGNWAASKVSTTGAGCKEDVLELIPHETDAIVAGCTPLIQVQQLIMNRKGLGSWTITNVTTNFDEYRTKYNTATGGKYSKSAYPYLVGLEKLTFSDKNNNYHPCSMYLGFIAKR